MRCIIATCALVVVAVVTTACGQAPAGRAVAIDIVPKLPGTVQVGDTEVVPLGDPSNPIVLATARDSQTSVRRVKITGELTFSCYDNSPNGATVRTIPIDEEATAQAGQVVNELGASVNISENSLRSRCNGNGAGSMLGWFQAEATFPDSSDPTKDSIERSAIIKFRYRALAIATFNIIGVDSTAKEGGVPVFADRMDALARALVGYDVVALQEVASKEQVDALAAKAGYQFSAAMSLTGGHYDNRELAFLSRYPLQDLVAKYAPWLGCTFNCPRHHAAVYAATINLDGKFPIRVIDSHFWGGGGEGNPRDDWRAEQARFIQRELIDPWLGRRIVFVGDTNGNSDLVTSGSLVDMFDITARKEKDPGGSTQTHCDDRIDVVFARRPVAGLYYNGVGIGCVRKMELSDHPLVSAILTW